MPTCNPVLRLLVLAVLSVTVACAGWASAQTVFAMGDGETVLLSEPEKGAFNRIFQTSADQHKAVDDMVRAATARLRDDEKKAEETREQALKAYRALPEDERRTPEARKALTDKLAAIGPDETAMRKALLADLKALLTGTQQESWKKFEYFLRREKNRTSQSGWHRDLTNVLALVEPLGLSAQERAPLADLLDAYERDLDGVLIELEGAEAALNRAMAKAREEAAGDLDVQGQKYEAARERHGKPLWEAAHKLARLNAQYVRRISAVIAQDKAAELQKTYEKVALREAFGPNEADEGMRSAPTLPGLDDQTRETVKKIVDEYSRTYEPLCRKIAVMEKSMLLGDGAADMTGWDPARRERGELGAKTQQKVRTLLSPAQFDAMLHEGRRRVDEWDARMSR